MVKILVLFEDKIESISVLVIYFSVLLNIDISGYLDVTWSLILINSIYVRVLRQEFQPTIEKKSMFVLPEASFQQEKCVTIVMRRTTVNVYTASFVERLQKKFKIKVA